MMYPLSRTRAFVTRAAFMLPLAACTAEPEVSRKPIPEPRAEVHAAALLEASPQAACLTEAIYFEAGAHSDVGRAAVAHVILNRAEDPRFPADACAVIREGEARGACQFSYRCSMDVTEVRWPDKHAAARRVATSVLAGTTPDPTQGALFFHAASIAPGWFATRERRGAFGGNIFYR